jgi:hypothetical protein
LVAARISSPSFVRLHAVQLGEKLVNQLPPRAVLEVRTARAECIDLIEE